MHSSTFYPVKELDCWKLLKNLEASGKCKFKCVAHECQKCVVV